MNVWLYVAENRAEVDTDQKIRTVLRRHFPNLPADDPLQISRTSRGKPYLPDLPQWHISVTHSGKWIICALSTQQVGIDLQIHHLRHRKTDQDDHSRYCTIARRFFHPAEADYVALSPQDRFFQVWTAKESYVKYTGRGVDGDFGSYSILPPSRQIPTGSPWQAVQATFQQIPFDREYTFCMCTDVPCCWHWIMIK